MVNLYVSQEIVFQVARYVMARSNVQESITFVRFPKLSPDSFLGHVGSKLKEGISHESFTLPVKYIFSE